MKAGAASRGRRLSLRDAADHLGVSVGQMYGLIRARRVPFHQDVLSAGGNRGRRGSNYYFYASELDAHLAATLVEPQTVLPSAPARAAADISDLLPREKVFR